MFTGVDRRLVDLLAYTTYWPRNHKCSPEKEMKAFSGFVSNSSDRMIRNSAHNARICGHVAESVCNSERGKSQVNKLNRSSGGPDEGRLNNRKLHEPSHSALALRHTQVNCF